MSECIVLDSSHSEGYARVRFEGRRVYAHRLAFYQANGYWPKVCRHSCDNPPCVNPEHLLDGTNSDNMRDMISRGRGRNQFKPGYKGGKDKEQRKVDNKLRMGRNKTHCKHGQPFTQPYEPGKKRRCTHTSPVR